VRWNLRNTAGALVPNGTYTFKLTAPPADGSGAALTTSQTVNVSPRGLAVRRDFTNQLLGPDGIGDVLTLSSNGVVNYIPGNGTGGFAGDHGGLRLALDGDPDPVRRPERRPPERHPRPLRER
jgi:hypothetical protein